MTGKKHPVKPKKNGASTGLWRALAIALITIIGGIAVLAIFEDRLIKPRIPEKTSLNEKNEKQVDIFFSSEDGEYLRAERWGIRPGTTESEIREALAALIKGPRNSRYGKTLPVGVRLLNVNVKDSTAIANFSSEIIRNHPGGSSGELQTIYSIVDTITLNFKNIKDVQILVEGKKEKTLAGHIDISLPLGPDRKIIS